MDDLKPRMAPDDDTDKSVWPDSDDEYYLRNRLWLEAAFEEAKQQNDMSDDVKEVARFIDYLSGKQWPGGRPSYKAKPVMNRVWPIFWELISLLTDIRPIFEIKALNKQFNDQEDVLNKLIRAWWVGSDADLSLAMIIIYGLLATGYGKLQWNQKLRNGEGDFELVPLGPTDVLPLGARNNLESSSLVIYQSVLPLQDFRTKFPIRGAMVKPDPQYSKFQVPSTNPSNITPLMYDMLSPGMRRVLGTPNQYNTSVFPRALYREYWFDDLTYNTSNAPVRMGAQSWAYTVQPGHKLYPRGRLMIMGGDVILHDGPNPYWHGRPPFAALRLNVVPWQFHGLSEMRSLMSLQDIMNNVLAGVLDATKKIVNPAFFSPANSISPQVWNTLDWSMPGARVEFKANSPFKPEFAPAPNIPQSVFEVMDLTGKEMDRSSGIASMSDLLKKNQVPSGETIEQMRMVQQTPIRLKGRNIEVFLRQLGQMSIPNMFQFYDRERRVMMLGPDGEVNADFDYNPNSMIPAGVNAQNHAMNFIFTLQPGTLLFAQKYEEILLYLNLRRAGDMSRKGLFKKLELHDDPDQIAAELAQERAQMAGPQPVVGRPPNALPTLQDRGVSG